MVFRGKRNVTGPRGASTAVTIFIQNTDAYTTLRNHISKPGRVVLGPALQRDKQNLTLEADTPMQVSGMIPQFDGVADQRGSGHPSLGRGAHDDRAFAVDHSTAPSNSFWSRGKAIASSSPPRVVANARGAPSAAGILTTSTAP